MQLIDYIGKSLKSDDVIEVLEHFDMSVIYDFDRLHENTADSYRSSARSAGFEFRFDAHQILCTIWGYIQPRSGFSAIDEAMLGAPCFPTFTEAELHAEKAGIRTSQSKDGSSWIRFEHDNTSWIHYQFSDGQLALVTFMRR
jgi:hypothetical protein